MLTQLSRFGTIAKLDLKSIRLKQVTRFFMKGSALQGTMKGGALGLESHIEVESSEPPEKIRHLIKMGEQTCFTLQSLINPVPVKTTVTLNGAPLGLEE
jgi:organic hydroperoxide reductase OsmC/OhrA